jgi:hypothetical protein
MEKNQDKTKGIMKTKSNTAPVMKTKSLVPRAGVALKHEFYLETIWLVSQFLEARLRSIITRVDSVHPGGNFTLEQSITRIKSNLKRVENSLVSDHFNNGLMDQLRNWKHHRNLLLKDLPEKHISRKRLESIAGEGVQLMLAVNSSYKKFKAAWNKSLVKVPSEEE